ncbi:Acetyltransferase (GNAT) family protein [Agrococcus baldri]|uniref:Acetyltransferase (GNAT) family protein n=1 Tax=Agrococcus baldri TaxID=153730 RepID=A0AA94HKD9_9MICO|nr:GNAT family N-acetyltransferase [Agrococcus baldri]SFR99790.1 Acetyltransferase (GNAT) family protein [Agrococcus baldri]
MSEISVRALAAADRERWQELFHGYRTFYGNPHDDAVAERVWQWALDPARQVQALVAELDGEVVGIAHWRRFARPSVGETGIYLDDLFADPAARGKGVGRALIARLQAIAAHEGASVVRWITADDNATAQRLYDRVATKTRWLTYDAAPTAH